MRAVIIASALIVSGLMLDPGTASGGFAPAAGELHWPPRGGVPRAMERVYHRAGRRFGVEPRLLAAIGLSESDHGRARLPGVFSGVNFAGCCAGPAQLCVVRSCGNVWQHYRVDADGDGRRRVHDRDDAFATAARYVVALERMIRSIRPRLLLAAYNAGPGNVRRYGGTLRSVRPAPTCAAV
jgi:hypothetical protein